MNKILLSLILCFTVSITDIIAEEELNDYLSNDEHILSVVANGESEKTDKGKSSLAEDNSEGVTPEDNSNCTVFSVNLMRCLFMKTRAYLLPIWKMNISDVSIPNTLPKGVDREQTRYKIDGALDDWLEKLFNIVSAIINNVI